MGGRGGARSGLRDAARSILGLRAGSQLPVEGLGLRAHSLLTRHTAQLPRVHCLLYGAASPRPSDTWRNCFARTARFRARLHHTVLVSCAAASIATCSRLAPPLAVRRRCTTRGCRVACILIAAHHGAATPCGTSLVLTARPPRSPIGASASHSLLAARRKMHHARLIRLSAPRVQFAPLRGCIMRAARHTARVSPPHGAAPSALSRNDTRLATINHHRLLDTTHTPSTPSSA